VSVCVLGAHTYRSAEYWASDFVCRGPHKLGCHCVHWVPFKASRRNNL